MFVANINFYKYLPRKLLIVIIISRFLGPKLRTMLKICIRSFVNPHPEPFVICITLKKRDGTGRETAVIG